MVTAESPPPEPDKTLIASTMTTDGKAQARDPLLKIAHDPSIPAATVATPLGTLSVLPPELRDEIYRLLCRDTYYCISKPRFDFRKSRRPWSFRHLSDLNMTGSSKSIRQEYLAVLHAEAVFSIQEPSLIGWTGLKWDEIPFVDQVQKVEIIDYPDVEVVGDWLCYRDSIDLCEENERLSKKGALEPSLGPSTMSEERLGRAIHWEIKFHPREYSTKTTNSGAGANQVVKAKEEFPGIDNS